MNKWLCMLAFVALAPLAHAQSGTAKDQMFVTKAAQGGLAEVKLGKMASEKAAASAVKDFGRMMVRDHEKANQELKQIAAIAGATIPTEPSSEQEAVAAKLGALNGTAFDEAYAKTMVDDHEKTIKLFEQEAEQGKNAALKAFASKTLPTLREHLEQSKRLSTTDRAAGR